MCSVMYQLMIVYSSFVHLDFWSHLYFIYTLLPIIFLYHSIIILYYISAVLYNVFPVHVLCIQTNGYNCSVGAGTGHCIYSFTVHCELWKKCIAEWMHS